MNILITGANGFIGKYLVEKLKKNHNLIELYNGTKYVNDNTKITCNLLDKNHINCFLEETFDIDLIIHSASKLASVQNINDLSLLYDNLLIYEHLALIIGKYKPNKVINFSSIAVYPNKDGEYVENSEIRPSMNSEGLYGLSKFCGENILDFFYKEIKISHLRIAQVYGDGMRDDRIIKIMQKELREANIITVFGNGRRVSNFINIETLIKKIVFFIENDIVGIFNIGENNLSYKDLALQIIRQYGNEKSKLKLVKHGISSKSLINTDKLKEMELKHGM